MTSPVGHYYQEAAQEVADCRMMPYLPSLLMSKVTQLATTDETFSLAVIDTENLQMRQPTLGYQMAFSYKLNMFCTLIKYQENGSQTLRNKLGFPQYKKHITFPYSL